MSKKIYIIESETHKIILHKIVSDISILQYTTVGRFIFEGSLYDVLFSINDLDKDEIRILVTFIQ